MSEEDWEAIERERDRIDLLKDGRHNHTMHAALILEQVDEEPDPAKKLRVCLRWMMMSVNDAVAMATGRRVDNAEYEDPD